MLSSRSDEFGLVHERRDETGGTREGARFKIRSFQSFELRIALVSSFPRGLSGSSGLSGLSGLFCCLTQRNQIDEIDQMNKTGWRTFSASCGSSTPRLSAGMQRLSQFFDLSRRASQIHARRICPIQSIDDIVPRTHKRKERIG